MKWLILLAVGLVAAENQNQLGDRIVITEQECDRLYKLNENWNANNYNDRAVLYVDLFFLCQDSLAEDKYAYIEQNHVDLSKYQSDDAKFPVVTSKGTDFMPKPPARSKEDNSYKQAKLADYLAKYGGTKNPMFKLTQTQSNMGQGIVDQQVNCELLALLVLKHPDEPSVSTQHTECMNKLNCLKEKFMTHHGFTLEKYPDYFPIVYKGRGTMINSPPHTEGPSLCDNPVQPDEYKSELSKWNVKGKLEKIGKAAGEKLEGVQTVGGELIKRLKKVGQSGDGPIMTSEEMEKLMDDVESITVVDEDHVEVKDEPKIDMNTFKKFGDDMLEKLSKMEVRGMEKIRQDKLERINEVRADLEPVDHFASKIGDHLKKIEANKLKPALKKTMKGLSEAESQLKERTAPAMDGVKEKVSFANEAGKQVAGKLKQDSSILIGRIKSEVNTKLGVETGDEDHPGGWFGEIAHAELEKVRKGNLEKMMAKLGHKKDGEDLMSDEKIVEMLDVMKQDIRDKADKMNIHGEEVRKAGLVLKNVLHSVLNAAKHGRGPAKGMSNKEVDDAKFMVNQLVDFATSEIFPNEDDDAEDETDMKNVLKNLPAVTSTTTIPQPPQPIEVVDLTETSYLTGDSVKFSHDDEKKTVKKDNPEKTDKKPVEPAKNADGQMSYSKK